MEIIVSPRGLVARIRLVDGDRPETQALQEALATAGIKHGIDTAALEDLAKSRVRPVTAVVARGTAPRRGERAAVEYCFSLGSGRTPRIEIAESSGPRLSLKGDVLARVIPASAGDAGRTVRGTEIPPKPGSGPSLRAGKHVRESGDGLAFVATADGIPRLENDRLHVSPVLRIAQDDRGCPKQLEFNGSVLVEGNVSEGSSIQASGDVVIRGEIQGGVVVAGGNVSVRGGIRHHSRIVAGCNVRARFAEHSRIRVGGDLVLAEDALFCEVECAGEVRMGGRVVGGTLASDGGIRARALGCRAGTRTTLVLDPRARRREWLHGAEQQFARTKDGLELIRRRIRSHSLQARRGVPAQPPPELKILEYHFLREIRSKLRDVLEARNLATRIPTPVIHVEQAVFAGVEVQMNGAFLRAKAQLPAGSLVEREGRILVRAASQ